MSDPGISVVFVEDNEAMAEQVRDLLERAPGFHFAGHFRDGGRALESIPGLAVDLVLMDLNLPDRPGAECIRLLKQQQPERKIAAFTVYEDEEMILAALRAGADGYMLKDTPPDLFLAELRVIHLGGASLTPRVARKIAGHDTADTARVSPALTNREREILNLTAMGFSAPEIAEELKISVHTVRRHIENIYKKLDVHSRSQAIREGHRSGLIDL